jgi:hypothetical protein
MEKVFRQVDAIYTTLFSTVLEKVIRNIQTNLNGTNFNRMRQHMQMTS